MQIAGIVATFIHFIGKFDVYVFSVLAYITFANVSEEGGCRRSPREGRQPYHPAAAQVVANRRHVNAGLHDMPQNAVRHATRTTQAHTFRNEHPLQRKALYLVLALFLSRARARAYK